MPSNEKHLARDVRAPSRSGAYVLCTKMNNGVTDKAPTERELIEEYASLTGSSEATARSVFMYICSHEDASVAYPDQVVADIVAGPSPQAGTSATRTERIL